MITVTPSAIAVLKAAKAAAGAKSEWGIRLGKGKLPDSGTVAIGVAISESRRSGDAEFEQDRLRIFVDEELINPLDGRTLDVRVAGDGPELVLRS